MLRKTGIFLRTLCIFTIDILVTVFLSIITIAGVSLSTEKSEFFIKIARFWAKTLLIISGIKLEIRGIENIEKEKTYTFVSNHQSNFDILVSFCAIPKNLRMVAKEELFKIPIFGHVLKKSDFIAIDRIHPKKAINSLKQGVKKIKEGINFLLFPEGTRTHDGELHPFKSGAFDLAIRAKTPIIPITISGTYDVNPKNRFLLMPGKVIIKFDAPVEVDAYKPKERDAVKDIVFSVIENNFNKIRKIKDVP